MKYDYENLKPFDERGQNLRGQVTKVARKAFLDVFLSAHRDLTQRAEKKKKLADQLLTG